MNSSRRGSSKQMEAALKSTVSSYLWTHPGYRQGHLPATGRTPVPMRALRLLLLRIAMGVRGWVLHPIMVLSLGVVLVLALVGLTGYAVMEAAVTDLTLSIDSSTTKIRTTERTVGDLLSRYGVTLDPFDSLDPPANAILGDGTEIVIRRAMTVWITDGNGERKSVKMVCGTVQDALKQANVVLGEEDRIYPDPDTMLTAGMDIGIVRISYETVTAWEDVPYNTVVKKASDIDKGEYEVVSEGQRGTIEKQVRRVMENGKVVSSYTVDEKTVVEAKDRVVLEGTYVEPPKVQQVASATTKKSSTTPTKTSTSSKTTTSSKNTSESVKASTVSKGGTITVNGKSVSYSNVVNGKATAYTHTGNATASGVMPKVGTVAVDPKVIPLGTRLYIPGYGFAKAEDTGDSYIRNYTIDLFMDTEAECIKWGVRSIKIYILD